jgi:hypothetical protein
VKNQLVSKLINCHRKNPIRIEKGRFKNNIIFGHEFKKDYSQPIASIAQISQIIVIAPSFIINAFLDYKKCD